MSERVIVFLLGVFAGVLANLFLDSIRSWRRDEEDRARVRAYLRLIRLELVDRWSIANSRETRAEAIDWEDAARHFDRPGSASILDQINGSRSIFDSYKDFLILISPELSNALFAHYNSWTHRFEELSDLPIMRKQLSTLTTMIEEEQSVRASRAYDQWLLLWLAGKS